MRVKLPEPKKPNAQADRHHVYGGANRKHSERWGCVIYLPRHLHTGTSGIHRNKAFRLQEQEKCQKRLEEAGWTREEFRETFGKSYL